MLTFKQFIKEDEKTYDWVQQYSNKDLNRIKKISRKNKKPI